MRPARGCEACRERHVKCVIETGDESCARCSESGRRCHFGPRFRFKRVNHVDSPSSGVRSRYELRYRPDQKWVTPRKTLNFVLEDGFGLEYGIPDDGEPVNLTSEASTLGDCTTSNAVDALPTTPAIAPSENHLSPVSARPHQLQQDLYGNGISREEFASPASISELSKRHEEVVSPTFSAPFPAGSTDAATPNSLSTPDGTARPNLSRREADLMQHFIRKIAPWMDVCDLTCQFTHEVPRRAMQKRMVLFAVLAVSSRHLAILAGQSEPAEAQFYQGQSVRRVIEALSVPPEALQWDDNLLSTVVCLRLYEELEHSTDERLHLRGMSRLIAAIPDFAHSGGLAEAACWQSLRQDIYISLVHAQPPSFRLESFERSAVFTFRDDGACANIIILLFAKILRQTYTPGMLDDADAWQQLDLDVTAWDERRFRLFQPIFYEAANVAENRPFPVIHMITPPQVAALQYYHACKTFLTLHRPVDRTLSGFGAAKRRRAVERDVAQEVGAIVGLAESNPFVENANFTALHLLRMVGYCISNPVQRRRVLAFLGHVESSMGWGTSMVVAQLQEQWTDLDDPGA